MYFLVCAVREEMQKCGLRRCRSSETRSSGPTTAKTRDAAVERGVTENGINDDWSYRAGAVQLKRDREMDPSTSNPAPKQKRRSYEAAFKLKVVSRAEKSNNSIASREFGVDEKQVREWRKMKADLEKLDVV
ncbi:hypothetical protein NDU88_004264 [Pleurodeles waltl]|uniref:Brinker DNA-binding domain-containing protein n=1 Tax=Pleurodeles waltl TaxID=8319 RepID=A0AAV7UEH4_PLEWA|nr:hypothetical protein NDU88_004264 [Pleurodeles waltl]